MREHHAQVTVRDTGIGISPDFLPHVFERFRQAESTWTRPQGGLGLGLAIVHHIVELHGGQITAHSEGVGRGATFVVTLPSAAATPGTADAESRSVATQHFSGLRVLVVTPRGDLCSELTTALRASGATVTAAASAEDALDKVGEAPDVLVTDLVLLRSEATSLVETLRGLGGARRGIVRAIGVDEQGAGDPGEARELGFDLVLSGPMSAGSVLAAIRQFDFGASE